MRSHTVCFAAAIVAGSLAACSDTTPPVEAAPEPVAAVPALPPPRLLSDDQLRRLLAGGGRQGRDTLLDLVASSLDTAFHPPAPRRATYDPAGDPSTWGTAQIPQWSVHVAFAPPATYAYGWMLYNGHIGTVTLRAQMRNSSGVIVQSFGPSDKSELNLLAPFTFDAVQLSVQMTAPRDCGYSLHADGVFSTYFLALPLPTKIGGWTIPTVVYGRANRTASDDAQQPACPADPDTTNDGGTTGGGSTGGTGGGEAYTGETYQVEACLYYDWYLPDGTYWFTETLSCWVVTTDAAV